MKTFTKCYNVSTNSFNNIYAFDIKVLYIGKITHITNNVSLIQISERNYGLNLMQLI